MNMNSKAIKILHRIMILLFLLAALFPIYWMLNTAFKTQGEVYSKIPTLIPKKPTLDNFSYLLFKTKFVNDLSDVYTAVCILDSDSPYCVNPL